MNNNMILDDSFFKSLDNSVLPIEQAVALPPQCYTDDGFYEFEKEAVFNHEWLCVGREAWALNTGDYFTTTIIGEPLVISRTREGELKAMSSVCQHRAMLVAEGYGNTRGFVCPYHHWVYGLDGALINAPETGTTCNFDKKNIRLPALKVEVWLGFVFVNFDLNAPPLAPRLSAVEEVLTPYDLENTEGPMPEEGTHFPWNWKVMFENNNDGYHANRLHQGPLHDFVPSGRSTFPDLPEDTAGYYRLNGTLHKDAAFNATQRALFPIFSKLSDEQRMQMVFANMPPTLSLVLTADMVIYLIVRADSAETHYMDTGVLFAPGAMQEEGFDHKIAMTMSAAGEIMAQDQHVDALVQEGLRSRFAVRSQYSWQEGAQSQFNKWLVPRYQAAWRAQKNDKRATGGNGRG